MNTRVYVSVMVKNSSSKWLTLKRSIGSKFAAGEWEFVNGSIDDGESTEQTAIRELKEETGINVHESELKPIKSYETTDKDGRWVVVPYIVTITNADVQISNEHTEYKWMSEQEIFSTVELADDYRKTLELLS